MHFVEGDLGEATTSLHPRVGPVATARLGLCNPDPRAKKLSADARGSRIPD
jgi:hypothetical protein